MSKTMSKFPTYRGEIDHIHLDGLIDKGRIMIAGDKGEYVIELALTPIARIQLAALANAYENELLRSTERDKD